MGHSGCLLTIWDCNDRLVVGSGLKVDAFVACGGKPDKSGFVRKDTLVKIIKVDFGLTINIEVCSTRARAIRLDIRLTRECCNMDGCRR